METKTLKNKQHLVFEITSIAILSALSVILYYFPKFPLPFLPGFLDIHFSVVPILIGTLAAPSAKNGIVRGLIISTVRLLLKLPSSSTAGVGELADFAIVATVLITAALIYHYHKNIKGAIIALSVSTLVWILIAIISNYILLVPMYIELYFNGDSTGFIGMCSMIPGINETNYMSKYLLFGVIPFNLILATFVNIVTFIIYKRVSVLFKKFN